MRRRIMILISALAFLLIVSNCKKNVIDYGDTIKYSNEYALLKVNYASIYQDNRSAILKVNGERVSSKITGRTPYPGGGYNTGGNSSPDFLMVKPGNIELSVIMPFAVDNGTDSAVLYKQALSVVGGNNYVAHVTDTAANTKLVVTEENFVTPEPGKCSYRFINLMPNVPKVDLYYGISASNHTADTLLAQGVEYLKMTEQFTVRSGQSRTWKLRLNGSAATTTPIATYASSSTFTSTRVYNVFACGYNGVTTAPRKPYVSFLLVR
ncbi:DUF4397 domain-containing protein [Niabella hirudinis]|uniref:DUF4397 domain-containing protein n=1 Tax=Niabella hirudinis TaxID=1285929 RepID=UPI003EBC55DB